MNVRQFPVSSLAVRIHPGSILVIVRLTGDGYLTDSMQLTRSVAFHVTNEPCATHNFILAVCLSVCRPVGLSVCLSTYSNKKDKQTSILFLIANRYYPPSPSVMPCSIAQIALCCLLSQPTAPWRAVIEHLNRRIGCAILQPPQLNQPLKPLSSQRTHISTQAHTHICQHKHTHTHTECSRLLCLVISVFEHWEHWGTFSIPLTMLRLYCSAWCLTPNRDEDVPQPPQRCFMWLITVSRLKNSFVRGSVLLRWNRAMLLSSLMVA